MIERVKWLRRVSSDMNNMTHAYTHAYICINIQYIFMYMYMYMYSICILLNMEYYWIGNDHTKPLWIKSKLTHTKGMRISVMHHIHQRGRNCVSEALDDGSKAGNSNDNVVCIINNIKACQEVSKALRKLSLMNPHRCEGFCKLEL